MAILTASQLKTNLGQHVSGYTGINQIVDIIDSIPSLSSSPGGGNLSNTLAYLISANGTTQNTATSTGTYTFLNIVTSANLTSNSVVVNPITSYQKIVNKSSNNIVLFPFVGSQLDGYGNNAPTTLLSNNSVELSVISPTQIYITG